MKKHYFIKCPICDSYLDPGEACDCLSALKKEAPTPTAIDDRGTQKISKITVTYFFKDVKEG